MPVHEPVPPGGALKLALAQLSYEYTSANHDQFHDPSLLKLYFYYMAQAERAPQFHDNACP